MTKEKFENTIEFVGFHGTDASNVDSIVKNNFKESEGVKQWLGNGVYFFVDDVSEHPHSDASNWAIAESWDNDLKEYKYECYAVIRAAVKVLEEKFLDITSNNGKKIVNYAREEILNKLRTEGGKKLKVGSYHDSAVIELLKKRSGFEVVKCNFYIKFARERKAKIISRMDNTTIISVSKPKENIVKESIEKIEVGSVS